IKLLYWDQQGFCLYYKVLQRGRFPWPSPADGVVRLTSAQLAMLWEGIDWVRRETGMRQRVEVPYDEDLANHIAPESCGRHREVSFEALTGALIGQLLSDETLHLRSADASNR
ncbi:MAG: IS66 family insertion sequence element accessory protein TnpB, partial [Pseudomonadota bacterium]